MSLAPTWQAFAGSLIPENACFLCPGSGRRREHIAAPAHIL